MVHQLANEPDARSLEVQGLNPYTYYRSIHCVIEFWNIFIYSACKLCYNLPFDCRFRMRQVNIVGTSPPSQPSRKIQTLQAPPDIAPANITLRTASETSLWLRWVVRMRSICLRGKRLCVCFILCSLQIAFSPIGKFYCSVFACSYSLGDLILVPVSCFIYSKQQLMSMFLIASYSQFLKRNLSKHI